MVRMGACRVPDRGSIPRRGDLIFWFISKVKPRNLIIKMLRTTSHVAANFITPWSFYGKKYLPNNRWIEKIWELWDSNPCIRRYQRIWFLGSKPKSDALNHSAKLSYELYILSEWMYPPHSLEFTAIFRAKQAWRRSRRLTHPLLSKYYIVVSKQAII